jgi:hypothetical protein
MGHSLEDGLKSRHVNRAAVLCYDACYSAHITTDQGCCALSLPRKAPAIPGPPTDCLEAVVHSDLRVGTKRQMDSFLVYYRNEGLSRVANTFMESPAWNALRSLFTLRFNNLRNAVFEKASFRVVPVRFQSGGAMQCFFP